MQYLDRPARGMTGSSLAGPLPVVGLNDGRDREKNGHPSPCLAVVRTLERAARGGPHVNGKLLGNTGSLSRRKLLQGTAATLGAVTVAGSTSGVDRRSPHRAGQRGHRVSGRIRWS